MTENKISENYDLNGLNLDQVEKSRGEHGANVLTPPRRTSLWKLYLEKYNDPIIRILLVAAAVSLVMAFVEKDFIETIGIILAIFFATTVGFYFERDAAKKFSVLTAMTDDQSVKVRRDGKVVEIARKDVVVGDVILVETGDEVPADALLAKATDLQINESSLTGEPITTKNVKEKEASDVPGAYPENLILRSSLVVNGRGEAVVVAVGDDTEIGKVAQKSTEKTEVETPLNRQLNKLATLISKVGAGISIAAFLLFLIHDILTNDTVWHGDDYVMMAEVVLKYFMMAVTLIVMAVPEGLPMAVTLSLALNMRRMLKSNNLVRKLHACETMGAVTVICTDKTGTLTKNKMTVVETDRAKESSADNLLYYAMAVNSTAELDENEGIGNPTEVALLLWLKKNDKNYKQLRSEVEIVKQQPFSTETKYMKTIAKVDDKEHIFIKGAPEIVLKNADMADDERKGVEDKLLEFQKKAMRTLAFVCDGKYQGIVAIMDPVREEVPNAIKQCNDAGVGVKIVTGDTAATAAEIGRQIGVVGDCITGQEWSELSDEEAYRRAADIKIMSRARPTDKQRLVEMLQKRGEVVAVTGDGTNDAPALNYAHVGLSLGSGTSVAKDASDMTLLDDSFGSIANAVMWGRSLYKNIQRFLFFQLTVNVAALLLVLGGSLIGTEMPLTVTQILWVNLIMDTFAAMALASLPPSREVMKDKPRNQKDFIINRQMTVNILGWGIGFFILMLGMLIYCERNGSAGISVHELTIFFTTFVMLQFWNLFNAKVLGSRHSVFHRLYADRGMALVLLFILFGQWLIVTFGGKMFRTEPLSLREWLVIILATSVVMWVGEVIRLIKKII